MPAGIFVSMDLHEEDSALAPSTCEATADRHRAAIRPPGNALYARNRRARRHTSPDAAAAPAGETHTYEADQDGDLNLQLTMVSFADAKAKKGETYVVYAAADDGAVARVYRTPWRNG